MVKLFCDRCGKEITRETHRVVGIGDRNNYVETYNGRETDPETTMLSKDICIDCAREIISSFTQLERGDPA